MKIFDWVHRKMQTNMDYRKVPRHKKDPYHVGDDVDGRGTEDRGETRKGETSEKAALLMDLRDAASIQQALDEILTIGTLGHVVHHHQEGFFDDAVPRATQLEFLSLPLASKLEEQRSSAAAAAKEADQGKKGDEPAVEAAAASAGHPNHHNMVVESFKKEMLEILGGNITGSPGQNVAAGEEGDLLEVPLLQETNASRKERITLADLFMASEEYDLHAGMVVEPTAGLKARPAPSARVNAVLPDHKEAKSSGANIGTKKAKKPSSTAVIPCRAKSGESNSLTKKLTPWKKLEGEDSSAPPQKLQRVIRRMLRKKIHPADDQMARDHVNASAPSMLPAASLPL